ncbi:hypothetical protein FN846DRAFT_249377 [Sphaerosporella brunnea]|uniref:Uncharacterized protein n=1 Tax=Sphaerosporella brunnea TaxID=1250544 RepID=A0A5J5FC45_9PEZI|nr:hypothetical protein FN846DRAFT_249377 [Sphaerosporella brunnea]
MWASEVVSRTLSGAAGDLPSAAAFARLSAARQSGEESHHVCTLCQVRMKIARTLMEPITITVKQKDESTHTHDLEEIFRLCGLPSAVKRVVQAEANKDYTAAQIFHALKGGGEMEGFTPLEAIGGASLKRGGRNERTRLYSIKQRRRLNKCIGISSATGVGRGNNSAKQHGAGAMWRCCGVRYGDGGVRCGDVVGRGLRVMMRGLVAAS